VTSIGSPHGADNDPAAALRDDGTRGSAGRRTVWLRGALATGEVALAVVLLVAAGLHVRSLSRLLQVNPGFAAGHVVTAQIALPAARYPDAAARRTFWNKLLGLIGALAATRLLGSLLFGVAPWSRLRARRSR
jgi:putative ABC transport system permease protein